MTSGPHYLQVAHLWIWASSCVGPTWTLQTQLKGFLRPTEAAWLCVQNRQKKRWLLFFLPISGILRPVEATPQKIFCTRLYPSSGHVQRCPPPRKRHRFKYLQFSLTLEVPGMEPLPIRRVCCIFLYTKAFKCAIPPSVVLKWYHPGTILAPHLDFVWSRLHSELISTERTLTFYYYCILKGPFS